MVVWVGPQHQCIQTQITFNILIKFIWRSAEDEGRWAFIVETGVLWLIFFLNPLELFQIFIIVQ